MAVRGLQGLRPKTWGMKAGWGESRRCRRGNDLKTVTSPPGEKHRLFVVGKTGCIPEVMELDQPASGSVRFSVALRKAVSTICWPMREISIVSGPMSGAPVSSEWMKCSMGLRFGAAI